MKFSKIFFLLFGATVIIVAASCKKSFFTDVNKNPNAPASVGPSLLLSTTETALGYTQGGDISRFTSLIMQQTFGANSQSQIYYQYGFNPGVFDNLWPDLYTSVFENNDTLLHLSDANGYNQYGGISRIIMAYTLQTSVDLWGKIPYSTALQGNGNLQPTYDDDKALYDTIASLVDVGITKLNNADPGVLVPGADDFIYGGDASKWIKFGHAIKARLYIHQSKGNATMAANALSEIALSFSGTDDNAVYAPSGSAETSASSWYQFNRDRPGDISFIQAPFSARLIGLNDPRYSILIDSINDVLGAYYGSVSSPTELITYDELLFAKAEETLRSTGDYVAAQSIFQSAITANMQKLGVAPADITAYVVVNGILPVTSVDNAIAAIAAQEYIALYLNPEAWVLWRRTASPNLQPIAGSAIPRRLLYPQSEYSYNGANVPQSVTLFSPKIFWDN